MRNVAVSLRDIDKNMYPFIRGIVISSSADSCHSKAQSLSVFHPVF